MKQYAFMLMGEDFQPQQHQCLFQTENGQTRVVTVRSFEEAKQRIVELQAEGVGALEVCGAFSPENAKELAELTHNTLPIGYIVHDPAQDALFDAFFGG